MSIRSILPKLYYLHTKFIFLVLTLITSSSALAEFQCQLDEGYEMPEDVTMIWFCIFKNGITRAHNISTDKFGAIDRQGKIVIPFEYDFLTDFYQDRAFAQKNNRWLLIDTQNQPLAEFDFQEVSYFSSTGIASFKKNDKWGYINSQGDIILEPQFDEIIRDIGDVELNEQQVAIFEQNGKQGAVNQLGKIIIPAQFDELRQEGQILFAINDDKMGIYDLDGRMVQPIEFDINHLGFQANSNWSNFNWTPLQKGTKTGAIDKQGQIVVPIEFDEVDIISKNAFRVTRGDYHGIYSMNQLIVPVKYEHIADSSEGFIRFKDNGKWGYFAPFMSIMMVDYEEAGDFSEGLAPVAKRTTQGDKDTELIWGYIDKKGQAAIPPMYEAVKQFKSGVAPVKLNGKWGVIDFLGNQIVPFEYDVIGDFENGYAIVANMAPQSAIKNFDSPNETDDISIMNEETDIELIEKLEKSGIPHSSIRRREGPPMLFGIINNQGNVILPVRYDDITQVSEGMIGIKKDNQWGFANQHGEMVYPYQFDTIHPPFEKGVIQVNNCYDENKQTIVSCDTSNNASLTRDIDKYNNVIDDSVMIVE